LPLSSFRMPGRGPAIFLCLRAFRSPKIQLFCPSKGVNYPSHTTPDFQRLRSLESLSGSLPFARSQPKMNRSMNQGAGETWQKARKTRNSHLLRRISPAAEIPCRHNCFKLISPPRAGWKTHRWKGGWTLPVRKPRPVLNLFLQHIQATSLHSFPLSSNCHCRNRGHGPLQYSILWQ